MLTFHNDPALKRRFIDDAKRAEAENPYTFYLAGLDLTDYPKHVGLPAWLIHAESIVRVGVLATDRPGWPRLFLDAVPVGVDDIVLEGEVLAPLMAVALRRALTAIDDAPAVSASVQTVIDLWQRDDLRSPGWAAALQVAREIAQAAVSLPPLRFRDKSLVPGQKAAAIRFKVSTMAATITGEGDPALNAVVGSLVFASFSQFEVWAVELVRLLRGIHAEAMG